LTEQIFKAPRHRSLVRAQKYCEDVEIKRNLRSDFTGDRSFRAGNPWVTLFYPYVVVA